MKDAKKHSVQAAISSEESQRAATGRPTDESEAGEDDLNMVTSIMR